nr:MAG TPA: hypothetical protein [Caudoviricetes sp.]
MYYKKLCFLTKYCFFFVLQYNYTIERHEVCYGTCI